MTASMASGRDRICAAVDFPSWREAEPFARAVAPEVGMLKVGLELFAAEGPPVVAPQQRSAVPSSSISSSTTSRTPSRVRRAARPRAARLCSPSTPPAATR